MTQDDELNNAYALKSPEDNRRLYARWADSYDSTFVAEMDYQLPFHAADAFVKAGGHGPVLDVGAGTGLVGERLTSQGVGPVDGTDISPEMLAVADEKKTYRSLFASDITQPMDVKDGTYAGIISAGTFTLGHVGPDAFDQLLRIAAPGALFVITINGEHFESEGFAAKLAALHSQIHDLKLVPVRYYGANAQGDHAKDEGKMAIFRKV
ncbi:methyltransferase domain-containing protein [Aliiroseovarius subalbicans]|uniref:class I SAM-dependent DNA methyltransferase n=1 Tax=Aliiroseovarius subalbicans TaxID=2925840 RepID=UPI001F571E23|nr:methyltransferase domain-containing protein [Aliiroseovarius subalbicans]MCI2399966.1 class I SAM-dependent methyltransferase [Aliiroseovarius subalbicans]